MCAAKDCLHCLPVFHGKQVGVRFWPRVCKNVSVRPTHLPNLSIKGDGVRVFLSGRDSP